MWRLSAIIGEHAMRDAKTGEKRERRRRGALSLGGVALVGALLVAALSSCVGGVADPGQWLPLTQSDGGDVLALADDPFNTNFVYAGTAGGQVYRAYAANRAEGVAGVGLPPDAIVSSLATDMKTQGLIYAGASDGFYASTDRGDHWAPRGVGLPTGDTVDALAVSTPANVLFAGTTSHGVFASSDAGQTWNPAASGLPANANINALLWEPLSQTLYAAVDGAGVFASTDGGASWASRNQGLSTHPYAFAAREPAATPTSATPTATTNVTPLSTATLYVGTDKGLASSTDDGSSWTPLHFSQGVQALALDPQHLGWLYAGTQTDVFRSTDDGATWASLAPGLGHPVTSLLSVVPAGQQTVLYAGSGPLQRFPPYASGSNGSPVLGTVILVLLFVIILYVFWRTRRRMLEADRRLPLGLHPELVKEQDPDESEQPDGIERFLSMTAPPTPHDGERPPKRGPSRNARDTTAGPDDFTGIEN
jgi:photosystem II stability/assembly factor-like uncharacterized protein